MSESLPVDLNGESVHAVEAPEAFTAAGPFHLELRNRGGPVHVHVRLGDDLSGVARVGNANHYVEGGETVRVPVGTAGTDEVTGRLEIISGYGAERERVEVTIAARDGDESDRSGPGAGGSMSGTPDRDTPGIAPTSRGDGGATPGGAAPTRTSPTRSTAGESGRDSVPSTAALRSAVADASAEMIVFVALAAGAASVGVWVIRTVGEPVLSVVVAGVVTAAVVVAGWLLVG